MPSKEYKISYETNSKKYGEVVKCGNCEGKGKVFNKTLMGETCPSCNGLGKKRI